LKIAVLYGGTSTERDISLVTGRAIGLALAGRGHEVLLVDTARGDVPVGPEQAAAAAGIGAKPPRLGHEKGNALNAVAGRAVSDADVVFVALHGGTGEDGTIQGLLELAGKRYTGSGVLASGLAMDKRAAKVLFREVGVPTPRWTIVRYDGPAGGGGAPAFPDDVRVSQVSGGKASGEMVFGEASELGGYPLIVKPNDQGSTVGLTLVREESLLAPAIELAAEYSRRVLMEAYIPGREMTVAILGETALPVVEITPERGLYDYESKYTKGQSSYVCPAEIPDSLSSELERFALLAYSALGCVGYARVDFRVTDELEPFCLEVNTVPGMTAVSLVPMAAEAAGISFPDLVEKIVELA
jgi:D-alanine-D-alanine ligase